MNHDSKGQQIFITGAPGWLGTRLVETIAHGLADHPDLARGLPTEKISVLTLPGSDIGTLTSIDDRVECRTGDIRDAALVQDWLSNARDALIIHVAGIIHPRRATEFEQINHRGGLNVLEAAENSGARRAVVMSSNSPFGVNPHVDHRFDENSPYRPYLGYGRSKMKLELATQKIHNRGRLQTVIVRAPWFYGPNQPERQSLFFSMVRRGKAPIVGSGNNLRSMTYIDNLCQGLMLAAISPIANGRAYWIADQHPYSMNEVIDTIEDVLKHDFKLECSHGRLRLPGVASRVAYGIDAALQRAGLYHQKMHVLSEMNKSIACDISRAEKELGYRPRYALREGMRESIHFALNRGDSI